MLKVDSKYRIVTVDRPGQRIGVALEDANPKERQSWVYIKPHHRGFHAQILRRWLFQR